MSRKGGKHVRWYFPKKGSYESKQRRRKRRERRRRDAYVTEKYGKQGHGACGRKNRYESRERAMEAAFKSMAYYDASPLRAYKCKFCGGWHLTSMVETRPDEEAD